MKKVAVITRTKNRPILLKRAMYSVTEQIYKDFIWVVVNDGGEWDEVNEIVNEAKNLGVEVMVIHNDYSQGVVDAVSNLGIKASDSNYIVVHDDDDSWAKEFLAETVSFLDSKEGEIFGGVVTHSIQVQEILDGNECYAVRKKPFNSNLRFVYLADVARENFITTNSFLYRRNICEKIGGYDDSLPVLGDWDFNLRFLLEADIAVIQKPLARHHIRINVSSLAYGNTVTEGSCRHDLYDMVLRNRYLRKDISDGKSVLGYLMNFNNNNAISSHCSWEEKLSVRKMGRKFLKFVYFSIKKLYWLGFKKKYKAQDMF